MEATAQATQRKITLESFDLVHARRKDVHCFNELLVQYPLLPERPGKRSFGQVVPDNMVVISEQPLNADSSFNVPLEPAKPFWMLEYVSKHNERKDYKESFDKYERELKVPYYLLFYPDNQDLILYRHNGKKYVAVKPNKENRYEVRDLNIEVALLDGWVRFWHEGVLLPLPADMLRELDDARRRVDDLQKRLDAAERELARLRGEPPQQGRRNGPKAEQ
jgi:Uma2 family endonuclease